MNRPRRTGVAHLLVVACIVGIGPLAAQQAPRAGQSDLPRAIAQELIEFFNRRETIRLTGESRIAPGSEVVGDVAVLGGPFVVAGRIQGRLVVINGDVRLEPGASILGDLTVVGGVVTGLDSVSVSGTVVTHRAPLRIRTDGERIAAAEPEPEPELSTGRDFGFGRTDLMVAAHRGYNRVEGLPIVVGPRFESRSASPLRAEALLIYRTASGIDVGLDELGYRLRVEKLLGGGGAVRIGATLHSEIEPIENRGLSDRENSLATFLFRRDYRDHYERTGWGAYLRVAPQDRPHELGAEFRSERHASVAAREPWSILDNDEPWRDQPVVAEGVLRSVAAHFGYDTRNEGVDPTAGWYVRASVERGIGGSLRYPPIPVASGDMPWPIVARSASPRFTAASLDLRRYVRLGPTSRLSVRALAAGSLDAVPLPPQRQHVLGGEGSLPGYRIFRFDCGARRAADTYRAGTFYPYYGCDRVALVQLEYRNDFPLGRGWGRKLGWDIDLGETPGWVVFFDAGRAWTERESRDGRTGGQDDFAADAGLGLRFGRLGIYWAVPLSGRDEGINFFVRYGSRL